jgi:hypothetical protein
MITSIRWQRAELYQKPRQDLREEPHARRIESAESEPITTIVTPHWSAAVRDPDAIMTRETPPVIRTLGAVILSSRL